MGKGCISYFLDGGEFVSTKYEDCLKSEVRGGIHHECIVLKTPKQNSIAKHKSRKPKLKEYNLCLLMQGYHINIGQKLCLLQFTETEV